jgi:hypothetical protein
MFFAAWAMDPNVLERLAVLGFFAIAGCVEAVRN